MKQSRGFSLIELTIIIAIVGVLAAVGASVAIFAVQGAVYAPHALNMEMLAEDAINKITDGDGLAKVIRFSRQIAAVATNSETFVDQDEKTVVITLNTGTNKLSRTINAVSDANFLYYQASSDIAITTGRNGALFLYYDANEFATAVPANVRRIEVNLIAKTGSGSFGSWQGQAEESSSIRVPKFQ